MVPLLVWCKRLFWRLKLALSLVLWVWFLNTLLAGMELLWLVIGINRLLGKLAWKLLDLVLLRGIWARICSDYIICAWCVLATQVRCWLQKSLFSFYILLEVVLEFIRVTVVKVYLWLILVQNELLLGLRSKNLSLEKVVVLLLAPIRKSVKLVFYILVLQMIWSSILLDLIEFACKDTIWVY